MTWQSLTNYNQDLKAFESSEEDWFDQNSVSQINGNWLNDLRSNMFVNSFRIVHLNINSIIKKQDHIFLMLDKLDIDILSLNETKLGINKKLNTGMQLLEQKYTILRKDRNESSKGGGILVFIKKCHTITEIKCQPHEIVMFKLNTGNSQDYNFVCSYKPPKEKSKPYLKFLNNFISENDLRSNLFIIGDLNLDMRTKKGKGLVKFCKNHNLVNYVKTATRSGNNKKRILSSSFIDVVLNNSASIKNTHVIDFPHSDHKIVLANCEFESKKLNTDNQFGN